MLTYNGYRYTRQKRLGNESQLERATWRCVYKYGGRYCCKSYATTYIEGKRQKASFRGQHCHEP